MRLTPTVVVRPARGGRASLAVGMTRASWRTNAGDFTYLETLSFPAEAVPRVLREAARFTIEEDRDRERYTLLRDGKQLTSVWHCGRGRPRQIKGETFTVMASSLLNEVLIAAGVKPR